MTIGERIKKLRTEKHLTQTELANYIDSAKETIYKYENGIVTNIPTDKLTIIAKVLDTTPAYLMGWSDSPSNESNLITEERLAQLGYDIEKLKSLDEQDLLVIKTTLNSLIDSLLKNKK